MEDYLGLLVSISDGLSFPKKTLFLSIRYSKYEVRFPVVSGGDTTVFNQGYFFRNYKVSGHDESDLPVLIELHEKKSLFKDKVIADLRVEAFNFFNYDYYEPLRLCLQSRDGNSTYEMQLKILFQLVKPSAEFVCTTTIDVNKVKPVAYQIEIVSASLDETLVDKKLYFSLTMDISKENYLRTRDVKGNQPQWNFRQIIASLDFKNQKSLIFHLNTVTHPHQQDSFQVIGSASFPLSKLLTSTSYLFRLPINSRKKLGMLTLAVKPIYPQSRDGTANAERIFQLQPNVFTMPSAVPMHHSPSYIEPIKDPLSPRTDSTMDRGSNLPMEPGALIPTPVLREKALLSTRSDTLRSRSEVMSQVSQRQLRMTEGNTVPSASWRVDNSVRESPMGVGRTR